MLSDEVKKLVYLLSAFALIFLYPLNSPDANRALLEGFFMLQDYIREHTLTCLVPALFIAGAVAAFVSQVAIIKYFAGGVSAWISYSVASVSGTMLAVCSCTVLPLFSSIYRRGAGLGPAIAFLYSGPAINVLAIILTARILGWELGAVRFAVSVLFAAGIGWIMQLLFQSNEEASVVPIQGVRERPLWQDMVLFLSLIGFLLAATLSAPEEFGTFYSFIYSIKWWLAAGFLGLVLLSSAIFFRRDERKTWMEETWSFTKLILPYLFIGVFVAGWLLGRPGTEAGLIPAHYIESLVGGESFQACLFASLSGALMYFATLTEIPILQGLLGAGMGKGPALSLLLAGPAISLPSLLALRSIMGWKKTVVYALLVILFSTLAGYFYGAI